MSEVKERVVDFDEMDKAYRLESGVLVFDGRVPESRGCSGMGSVAQIGIWKRHSIACALVERDGKIWFHWGERSWHLGEGTFLRHTFVFPLVRRFRLYERGSVEPAIDAFYWYRAKYDGFPEDDFLRYVAKMMGSNDERIRFGCVWSVTRHGQYSDLQELSDMIEACVRKSAAKSIGPLHRLP